MNEEAIPVSAPSFVAKNPPQSPRDLTSLPLLNLEIRPEAWANLFEQNQVSSPAGGGMIFEQFALVTQAAIAGLGVAILPRFLIQTELDRGELIPLLNLPIKSAEGYYLMTPTYRTSYTPTIALRKWFLEQTAIKD